MTASGGPFELNADLIVIGFGKGGKTLAATLGRQGKRVVMVERSAQMYGGTCINIGCVPTRSMVYQAEQLEVGTPHAFAYRAAIDTTQGLTAYLRGQNFAMLDNLETVTVLTGTARFVNTTTVGVRTVDGVHAHRERAHHRDRHRFGTRDSRYPWAGRQRPGGDQHGVALGARVAGSAAGTGVDVLTAAQVTEVVDGTIHYRRNTESCTVEADSILVALGRRAVTDDLGLEAAGVAVRADGSIIVDEHLRTSQLHLFAVGDVNGGPQFTYISLDDYRIVLGQLIGTGGRSTSDRDAVPYSLFVTPLSRARIVGGTRGMMKVVVDAGSERILGAALLTHDSHEVINTVALAMRHGITASVLRDEICTHPSMTEAFNQLLGELY